jgi:hypothetical protein
MHSRIKTVVAVFGVLAVSGCVWHPPAPQAYWQRVEDNSALYMTGPKAQQALDENIAACVREVDELVELGALRETTPPDTHSEYHRALQASGDLDFYDTPTRHGERMVSHTQYHDFDSCMRHMGWERVRFVRYQVAKQSQETYKDTTDLRLWGLTGDAAQQKRKEKENMRTGDYAALNNR